MVFNQYETALALEHVAPDVGRRSHSTTVTQQLLDEELAGSKKHVQTIIIKDGKLKLVDTDGTTINFAKVTKLKD